jgi:4-hydroxythreonine-4-phosphate dehydrogenase
MGCPSSVGPEISLVAVREARRRHIDCRIVGDLGALTRAAEMLGLDPTKLVGSSEDAALGDRIPVVQSLPALAPEDRVPGEPTPAGGRAQLAWIDHATLAAQRADAVAIVTGPVSKEVIAHSGAPGAAAFSGHTEHIARLLGSGTPVMVFVADGFAVALVTTHLPLRDVSSALSIDGVGHATIECVRLLVRLGKRPARVLVSALNPHAGEGGMFGEEETRVIGPAVEQVRAWIEREGVDATVEGPSPAEAAFRIAMGGAYDGVVAMYHDQATIPMKLRYFGRAVNVTAGLSIIRTSVDHGTAYDIAGKGKADAGSLLEAIRLADKLARAGAPPP